MEFIFFFDSSLKAVQSLASNDVQLVIISPSILVINADKAYFQIGSGGVANN